MKIGKLSLADYADTNKEQLGRLGQGKLSKDIDKALGSDGTMRSAEKAGDKTALDEAANKFFAGQNKSDISKSMNVDSVFADPNSVMAQAQLGAIARTNTPLMSSILQKANGPQNPKTPY